MKRLLLVSLFTSVLLSANAFLGEGFFQEYRLDTSFVDSSLGESEAVYEFHFENGSIDGKTRIIYSIDGKSKRTQIVGNTLHIKTVPGKHIFQFYYNSDFNEVYTDSLEITGGHRDIYRITLWEAVNHNVIMDKPVIYLYPEKETEVSVKMDIKGKVSFTYPLLEGSWDFTAQPNGDLHFGEKTYNYLFWEAHQSRYLSSSELAEGFIVTREEVVSFLEDKLTEAGLTTKEQADFITYWGPRLAANALNFVRFEFNETCNRYAELSISPKPASIYRIYMAWMPITSARVVAPQKIEKITRNGFTVLEWGGFEASVKQRKELSVN